MPFKHSLKQTIKEFLQIAIISLAIILPVRYFLIQPFYVKGASMEPNFYNRDYLIIDELSYRFREPIRGEVVVLRRGRGFKDFFIKRIIGLPGERVVIENGEVFVYENGSEKRTQLDESGYLAGDVATYGNVDIKLGEDEFFVLGDNRAASMDSRSFGTLPRKAIVGRTWLRGWPLDELDHFKAPEYTSNQTK